MAPLSDKAIKSKHLVQSDTLSHTGYHSQLVGERCLYNMLSHGQHYFICLLNQGVIKGAIIRPQIFPADLEALDGVKKKLPPRANHSGCGYLC